MIVGVLALQGDFSKHEQMLQSLDVTVKQVRKPAELVECDGLIIPGGESTTLFRQLDFIQLRDPLIEFAKKKPVFGTCAGLILMSEKIEESSFQPLDLIDVIIERNAFGRQIESFHIPIQLNLEKTAPFEAFFIRAPQIIGCGEAVEILATFDNKPVLVRQGKHLGACFHPELTQDPAVHRYFLRIVKHPESL